MSSISLVLLLILLPPSTAPQDGLAARNEAFLRAVRDGDRDSIAAFFPSRGEWTWVQRKFAAPPGHGVSAWRFAAADTRRAIGRDGPACWSFEGMHGEVGPVETMLSMVARMNDTRWRRAGATRFVPPRELDDPSAFVEWRREDGRWVVSSFGDATHYASQAAGPDRAGEGDRDTTVALPATPVYAAGESWYVNNDPFDFAGHRYVKYGLPRPIDAGLLRRIGQHGSMAVYAEKRRPGEDGEDEVETLYIPVRPGEYQPYQGLPRMIHCG